jgi:hypothetical protein
MPARIAAGHSLRIYNFLLCRNTLGTQCEYPLKTFISFEEEPMRKNLVATFCLVLLAVALVFAGGAKGKWDKAAALEKMRTELNLSFQQVSQLDALYTELEPLRVKVDSLYKEVESLKASSTPNEAGISAKKAELMAAKSELKSKRQAGYQRILTAEQLSKLDEMMKAQAAEHAKK